MTAPPASLFRRMAEPDPDTPGRLAAICLGAAALEGDIAAIDGCSAPDTLFRWPMGVGQGPGAAMAAGLADLAARPGAACLLEDVLHRPTPAAASDEGPGDYVSARAIIVGGARPVATMAEFWMRDGVIRDAWLLRDGAAALPAGHDPRGWAAARVAAGGGAAVLGPQTDEDGVYGGRGSRDGPAGPLADHLLLMMEGEMAEAARALSPACGLHLPGGLLAHGRRAALGFWADLRATLPGAVFRIDHALGLPPGDGRPGRAAVRWSLYGRHEGDGRFGPPSGRYLNVLGMTHAEFGPEGIHRLWTLIDDPAICLQAVAQRGG